MNTSSTESQHMNDDILALNWNDITEVESFEMDGIYVWNDDIHILRISDKVDAELTYNTLTNTITNTLTNTTTLSMCDIYYSILSRIKSKITQLHIFYTWANLCCHVSDMLDTYINNRHIIMFQYDIDEEYLAHTWTYNMYDITQDKILDLTIDTCMCGSFVKCLYRTNDYIICVFKDNFVVYLYYYDFINNTVVKNNIIINNDLENEYISFKVHCSCSHNEIAINITLHLKQSIDDYKHDICTKIYYATFDNAINNNYSLYTSEHNILKIYHQNNYWICYDKNNLCTNHEFKFGHTIDDCLYNDTNYITCGRINRIVINNLFIIIYNSDSRDSYIHYKPLHNYQTNNSYKLLPLNHFDGFVTSNNVMVMYNLQTDYRSINTMSYCRI